jgi:hypothetical protein
MSEVSPSNSSYRVGLNLNRLPKEDMVVDQISEFCGEILVPLSRREKG